MGSDHTFIVGDVHGCFDELMLLLEKAQYDSKKHRLMFVGDLINKGEDSLKVLKWVRQNKLECVIGNHELKFIEGVEKKQPLPPALLQLQKDMGDQLKDWMDYIKSWPSFIEEEDFLLVHAGLIPNEHPRESQLRNLVNVRYWNDQQKRMCLEDEGKPWHDYYKGDKLVIYGHWAKQGVSKKNNSICLDSGCVYGRELTGVFLPSRRLVSIDSLKKRM